MRKASLNEVQDLIYDIFVEYDRICRKHNIKYSMEGGTLLGAVKYRDYVPWDDDIDVIMLRSEYEKFLKVALTELNKDFFLQSYNNVPQFPLNYAKLCYNGAKICDYDYSHLQEMHHGVFIDIFPIDNVNREKLRLHCAMVGVLTGARKTKLGIKLNGLPIHKNIIYKMLSLLPMRNLVSLLNLVCTKDNKKTAAFRYEICNPNRKFPPLRTNIYENLIELPFRDRTFYAVKDYDEFLCSRFGEDYMKSLPPEEKRRPSHCTNIYINE